MPLITEGVKDIVGYAKMGPFHAQPEDLRLKWLVLGEIPKARFQEAVGELKERISEKIIRLGESLSNGENPQLIAAGDFYGLLAVLESTPLRGFFCPGLSNLEPNPTG